jgi:capsular polysaccharide biosynthesis protein
MLVAVSYNWHHYVIKFVSDLWQVADFLRILRFPPLITLTVTINWNIVESGVKHHNPQPSYNWDKEDLVFRVVDIVVKSK